MTPEAEKRLITKYPKIFQQHTLSPKETNMCWGFSCEDGWEWLINELCAALQWDTDKNEYPQIVATQVKEKFGTLRFYTESLNDTQDGMIRLAMSMSGTICEVCGSHQGVSRTVGGWVKTICVTCQLNITKELK